MKYRFKFKGNKNLPDEKKETRASVSPKRKMFLLILWSVTAIALYFASARSFAMTPVIICELLLLFGLVAYFVNMFRIKNEREKNGEDSERLVKLLDLSKYLLIFIIPLIFIIMFDFIVSSIKLL